MASMRDIKRRKKSVSSTQKITKAMKLVSTVKLQKAKKRAEDADPYFNYMYNTLCSMLFSNRMLFIDRLFCFPVYVPFLFQTAIDIPLVIWP